ncbi:hypothetical protein [Nitrosomonas sp. Nm58]|uniref:hypothetical protein n=1 Tax=Nitrosomonas sp. Nm58 TaxID=200126 RepID=UPI000898C0A9|nr:hypothetical protein [Nitrosomonas sp. Nm58]SDY17990.1 hypothetical protein SAMN05421754_100314 [Nitrosomonas sp. Nm58]
MLSGTVVEVAIGLVFCYASVALITSSIYESIASFLGLRSKSLLTGIKKLLNAGNPCGEELLLRIYNHALVHPTGNGAATSLADLGSRPSYIDSKNFSLALIDAIQSAPDDFARLSEDIDAIKDEQIRKLLRGMYERSAGKMEKLHEQLVAWFDAGMDRVAGSFKRQSQVWCFGIAFVLAAMLNIDSIHLFSTLWKQPTLAARITMTTSLPLSAPIAEDRVLTANDDVAEDKSQAMIDSFKQLEELPIGWQNQQFCKTESGCSSFLEFYHYDYPGFLLIIFGWLITASASLFGAPFWFDLLQHLTHLRGTGPKPKSTTMHE